MKRRQFTNILYTSSAYTSVRSKKLKHLKLEDPFLSIILFSTDFVFRLRKK